MENIKNTINDFVNQINSNYIEPVLTDGCSKVYKIEPKTQTSNPKINSVSDIAKQFENCGSLVKFNNINGEESLIYEGLLYVCNEQVVTRLILNDCTGKNFNKTLKFIKDLEKTIQELGNIQASALIENYRLSYLNYCEDDFDNAYGECRATIKKYCFAQKETMNTMQGIFQKGITDVILIADRTGLVLNVYVEGKSYAVPIMDASQNIEEFFISSGYGCASDFWENIDINS